MAYVPVLGRVLNESKGDPLVGHQLFTKHCATCHTLFGEGNKVGPDLTTADRKNREALLVNILDPSGYIRPEFVSHSVVLSDGRVLVGLVVESNAQNITLVDAKNQRTTVERPQIEQLEPSAQSLMPERLLETLQPQEVRDLFSYLQAPARPDEQKSSR
jgi:putative heme-binding domain-containing protein